MKTKMKTVRKQMTAGDLKGIIDLPNYADNQRVEVTVSPGEEERKKILSDEEIAAIWSRIEGYLVGTDLDKSKTLDDWRRERMEERYGIKLAD